MLRLQLSMSRTLAVLHFLDGAEFVRAIKDWAWWITLGSLIMFLGSLWFVSWLIIRLPADYFTVERHPFRELHPALQILLRILGNLFGLLLIITGIVMLFAPGQGVITILLGLSAMSFPGKHQLVRWILLRKSVRRGMNWIRRKADVEPLEFDSMFPVPPDQRTSSTD